MDELKISVTTSGENPEVVIRHGEALQLHDPVKLNIKGQLKAPRAFYDTRKNLLVGEWVPYFGRVETHVIVNRNAGTITLQCQEDNVHGDVITGQLKTSTFYEKLGINTGHEYTPADLAKMLRKNRYLFADSTDGMKLISELNSFTAKVNQSIEQKQDTRANKTTKLEQAVESNIPVEMWVNIPLFEGYPAEKLKVEILLEARHQTVVCYLESIEALEAMHNLKDKYINDEISAFVEDGITVIEIWPW